MSSYFSLSRHSVLICSALVIAAAAVLAGCNGDAPAQEAAAGPPPAGVDILHLEEKPIERGSDSGSRCATRSSCFVSLSDASSTAAREAARPTANGIAMEGRSTLLRNGNNGYELCSAMSLRGAARMPGMRLAAPRSPEE